MHNLGRVRRGLNLVHAVGKIPQIGADIVDETNRNIGQLRTAYPCGDGWVGVAMIQQKALAAGQNLLINATHLTVLGPFRSGLRQAFPHAVELTRA